LHPLQASGSTGLLDLLGLLDLSFRALGFFGVPLFLPPKGGSGLCLSFTGDGHRVGAEHSRGPQGESFPFWRVHGLERAWQWHSSWRSSKGAWTLQNMPEESLFPLCSSYTVQGFSSFEVFDT
jgi:hypothetical protein